MLLRLPLMYFGRSTLRTVGSPGSGFRRVWNALWMYKLGKARELIVKRCWSPMAVVPEQDESSRGRPA
jgi:hypothetical protein